MTTFTVLNAMIRYVGKVRTLRNEIRTERLLNSFPAHLQHDIGWPERRKGSGSFGH
ncbi:hypothetical protein [Mesorhizobium sp. A623]